MMSVDAPMISPAHQTTTEPLICLIRTPACRHDTCGLPRQPDSSAFRLARWKNTGFTARVPPIAKSAPASSTRFQISTRGPISAPKPPPATPASAQCCRQSGTLPFLMQEKSGADPADAAPEYWHHVHNRLSVNETPRPYTSSRHQAWLHRRRVTS